MSTPQHHTLPDGRRIAFRFAPGRGPCLVFLPGYRSDMSGTKASAVMDEAAAQGRACLLFDYSGCGLSEGDFADGTLSRWRDEALALIGNYAPGPVLLVGSSMGGWLMLLVARALAREGTNRLAGMIGIAAAPDFTRWSLTEAERALLASGETLLAPNPYGLDPTPTHPGFFADAEAQVQLEAPIALACPVRLLHGQRDGIVPWEVSTRLAERLLSDDVQVTLIKDGDHTLSRASDLALIKATVAQLTG